MAETGLVVAVNAKEVVSTGILDHQQEITRNMEASNRNFFSTAVAPALPAHLLGFRGSEGLLFGAILGYGYTTGLVTRMHYAWRCVHSDAVSSSMLVTL